MVYRNMDLQVILNDIVVRLEHIEDSLEAINKTLNKYIEEDKNKNEKDKKKKRLLE